MYENDYMYAIERNDDYLAHYGVRGMKWGVRKAIASGNERRLSRQYAKAQKKLAKLDKQASKADKYKKRAVRLGVGAAAAGGLAALGTTGVANITQRGGKLASKAAGGIGGAMSRLGASAVRYGAQTGKVDPRIGVVFAKGGAALKKGGAAVSGAATPLARDTRHAATAIRRWGSSNSISKGLGSNMTRLAADPTKIGAGAGYQLARGGNALKKSGITNNTIARVGAGVVGAGLAAGAARNAYKAATAQKRAAQFRSEMNKAFAGTKYANGAQRQGKKRRR